MNSHLIAEICAGIAVVATIVYLVLGVVGIQVLRGILDQMKNKPQ